MISNINIGPFVESYEVEKPTVEPASVPNFKLVYGIDFSDHDDRISHHLTTARALVERFLGMSLVKKTYVIGYEQLSGEAIELPYGPVISVSSVTYSDGAEIPSDIYRLSAASFPRLELSSDTPVRIEYNTGFEDVASISDEIVSAILACAYNLFTSTDTKPSQINWKAQIAHLRRPSKLL